MRKSRSALQRLLLTALAIVLLASACGSDETATESASSDGTAGDDAPSDSAAWPHDFSAPLLGGGTFEAGDYEGQDLVLWFWAPW